MPDHSLVYFFHIPKTAGVSLSNYLSDAVGGPPAFISTVLWDHLVRREVAITDATRIVCGHFGGLLPLWLGRPVRMLTTLRHPVARALSHINHVRRAPDHPFHPLAAGLSVEEYCDHPLLRRTVSDFQARYLATLSFSNALLPNDTFPPAGHAIAFENALYSLDAADGLHDAACAALDRIDAVGVVDEFARSLRLLARVFGWPPPAAEPRRNSAEPGQQTVESLTPGERTALERLNRVDVAVYEHARAVFHAQCERFGVPA